MGNSATPPGVVGTYVRSFPRHAGAKAGSSLVEPLSARPSACPPGLLGLYVLTFADPHAWWWSLEAWVYWRARENVLHDGGSSCSFEHYGWTLKRAAQKRPYIESSGSPANILLDEEGHTKNVQDFKKSTKHISKTPPAILIPPPCSIIDIKEACVLLLHERLLPFVDVALVLSWLVTN